MTRMHLPCDTPHCPNDRARKRNRCVSCMNHKQRHGMYPQLPAPPRPYAGPAGEGDWLFHDELLAAIRGTLLLGMAVGE